MDLNPEAEYNYNNRKRKRLHCFIYNGLWLSEWVQSIYYASKVWNLKNSNILVIGSYVCIYMYVWVSTCSSICDPLTEAEVTNETEQMKKDMKWKKVKKNSEIHFLAGQTWGQLWSWIWPIKPLWFLGYMHNAVCEKSLWTSITWSYALFFPMSIEQPSHNSPELWNWLTASLFLFIFMSARCEMWIYLPVCLHTYLSNAATPTPHPHPTYHHHDSLVKQTSDFSLFKDCQRKPCQLLYHQPESYHCTVYKRNNSNYQYTFQHQLNDSCQFLPLVFLFL